MTRTVLILLKGLIIREQINILRSKTTLYNVSMFRQCQLSSPEYCWWCEVAFKMLMPSFALRAVF